MTLDKIEEGFLVGCNRLIALEYAVLNSFNEELDLKALSSEPKRHYEGVRPFMTNGVFDVSILQESKEFEHSLKAIFLHFGAPLFSESTPL